MRKLLVLLIPVLLTAALAGCSQNEEVVGTTAPASGTHTATADSPTATGSTTASVTPSAVVTETPTPSEVYAQAMLPGGFQISYPSSWYEDLVSESPYMAKYFHAPPVTSGAESLADLEVYAYENPNHLSLETLFDGRERPNLFSDAADGYEPFSAGGTTGYLFHNVLGITKYTVVALSADSIVFEFADPQKHQSDGVFLRIVSSLTRLEG